MLGRIICLALVASAFTYSSDASARRTAIDQDENGNGTQVTLSGYCDLNGDDCDRPVIFSYLGTPYTVSFNGGDAIDRFYVHGNGLLTFGSAIDFSSFFSTIAIDGLDPALTDYGLNLVSVGQNNQTDFGAFFQSADYGIDGDGRIFAEFYTCVTPQFCRQSVQRLTLTPTADGFLGEITGVQFGNDRGYVVDGVFTPTGNSFRIAATITGLTFEAVPEPATWAMMIGGLGATGSALRRRRRNAATPALARN